MADLREGVTLYRCADEAADSESALLAVAAGPELQGFVYAPKAALWVRARGGVLEFPPGEARPDTIFELRLFNAERELRWVRGAGAAMLSEVPSTPKGWKDLDPVRDCRVISRTLLLWGARVAAPTPGWTTLGSARTGAFQVPIGDPGERKGVGLLTDVYLAPRDDHGNVGVVEERSVELKIAANATEAA